MRYDEVIKDDRLYAICPHVEGRIKNLELEDMKDCSNEISRAYIIAGERVDNNNSNISNNIRVA